MPRAGSAGLLIGTRLMTSTPPATTTSWIPAFTDAAAKKAACCEEPHWRSIVTPGTLSGSPAESQAVRATFLPQLMLPGATVAVRVDSRDHSRIALSLGEEPPTVTLAASGDAKTGSAARILELGEPCKAVIVQSQPLGMRNPKGDDMYAFVLTVMAEGRAPYQIQVGNPVPAPALPLLYPGNTVPAKRMPDGDERELAIDWHAALAQVSSEVA